VQNLRTATGALAAPLLHEVRATTPERLTMNWIKRVFCAHRYEWMRNIYGDEINMSGGKRSLWRCAECGKVQVSSGAQ